MSTGKVVVVGSLNADLTVRTSSLAALIATPLTLPLLAWQEPALYLLASGFAPRWLGGWRQW